MVVFSADSMLGKPPAKELLLGAFVNGLGQMLDALLIAPRVVDDQPPLVLAEVKVRVVEVLRGCNPLTLGVGELRVSNLPIFIGGPQDWVERAELPLDQVLGPHDVHLVAAGQ